MVMVSVRVRVRTLLFATTPLKLHFLPHRHLCLYLLLLSLTIGLKLIFSTHLVHHRYLLPTGLSVMGSFTASHFYKFINLKKYTLRTRLI